MGLTPTVAVLDRLYYEQDVEHPGWRDEAWEIVVGKDFMCDYIHACRLYRPDEYEGWSQAKYAGVPVRMVPGAQAEFRKL